MNHREHREIIVLKKKKTLRSQRKKTKKVIATDEHGNTRIKKNILLF